MMTLIFSAFAFRIKVLPCKSALPGFPSGRALPRFQWCALLQKIHDIIPNILSCCKGPEINKNSENTAEVDPAVFFVCHEKT